MGIFDWFQKRRRPEPEVSPGGSPLLRYGGNEFGNPEVGFTEHQFLREREEVYDRFFGKAGTVSHEIVPLIPHLDVYIHPPGHAGRDFYTLVTGGMSDLQMTVPEGYDGPPRAELVLYVREPKEEYISLLRQFARFPHANLTWFGPGHTIHNGTPPQPLFEDSELNCLAFSESIVRPDQNLHEELTLQGDSVRLLWVIPITSAELQLKLDKGFGELLDLFDRVNHPFVLDEKRRSYV